MATEKTEIQHKHIAKEGQICYNGLKRKSDFICVQNWKRGEKILRSAIMTLNEMIYHRKSCRSFTQTPVDAATIEAIRGFAMKPLYPDIKVQWDVVPWEQVRCLCPWSSPQVITIYSQEKEGYLENAGFLFQQMDLYLQTLGLGVCWLGLARMRPKWAKEIPDMGFVIMLAFGFPKGDALRHDLKDFKRKTLAQIADVADSKLEPARLAPSAVNSQPWYFAHRKDALDVYCTFHKRLRYMNRIDMGIALAHLYVANSETFRFFKTDAPEKDGAEYIGSVRI